MHVKCTNRAHDGIVRRHISVVCSSERKDNAKCDISEFSFAVKWVTCLTANVRLSFTLTGTGIVRGFTWMDNS